MKAKKNTSKTKKVKSKKIKIKITDFSGEPHKATELAAKKVKGQQGKFPGNEFISELGLCLGFCYNFEVEVDEVYAFIIKYKPSGIIGCTGVSNDAVSNAIQNSITQHFPPIHLHKDCSDPSCLCSSITHGSKSFWMPPFTQEISATGTCKIVTLLVCHVKITWNLGYCSRVF